MRLIELDARGWNTPLDFVRSLKIALGSPQGHGNSVNAFVDSMIYGGMNSIEPPYAVRITNIGGVPKEVADYISLMISAIQEARLQRLQRRDDDIEVSISVEAWTGMN
jgi:hypothetical protein